MKEKNRIYFSLLLVIGLYFFKFPMLAFAGNEKNGSFTVQAVLPENQLNDQSNYFQLLVKPGEEQIIKVKISNYSKTEQTFLIKINQATTNSNGLLVYDEDDKSIDDSLTTSISDVARLKAAEITVAGDSEKEVEIHLAVPERSFEGILLGGITVSKKEGMRQSNEPIAIKNSLAYTIALLLTTEADASLYGETDIHLAYIQTAVSGGRKFLQIAFQNPYPEIVKELSIEGKIYTEDHKELVTEKRLNHVKFAPNSTLLFEMELSEEVDEGLYWFEGIVLGSSKSWEFSEEIKIDEKEKQAVKPTKQIFKWHYILIPIIFIGVWLSLNKYKKGYIY